MNYFQQVYKGKTDLWRWIIVISVTIYPFIGNTYDYLFNSSTEILTINTEELVYIPNKQILYSLLKQLLFFVFFIIGVLLIHKRNILSLITAKHKFDRWRYVFAITSWSLCIILYLSFTWVAYPEDFVLNYSNQFFTLLLIAIVIAPIIAFFKALFFRGYLLQGMAILVKRKITAVFLVSVIYTIIAGYTFEIDIMGYQMLLFYFVSAFIMGVITVLDNRLELTIGIQTANNVVSLSYITSNWYGASTYALLLDSGEPKMLFLIYIPLLILLLYFWLLKYIYQWKNIKNKLLEVL